MTSPAAPRNPEFLPAPAVRGRSGYAVPKPGGSVALPAPQSLHALPLLKLDANEGVGPGPELAAHIADSWPELLRRYPDARQLRTQLAQREGVPEDHVLITAGADEAIDRCCRAMLCPGRKLILPTPSFEMISKYAEVTGAALRAVSWWRGPFPRADVLRHVCGATALIAVVSPNNPTGVCASPADISTLAAAAPHALIMADLAYAEFAGTAHADALRAAARAAPNAVYIRTLSKAWGLAGLRIGYVVGAPAVLAWLQAVAGPYPCAGASLALASHWLRHGARAVDSYVARVARERSELAALLEARAAEVWPGAANFAFARFDPLRRRALDLWEALRSHGIVVRGFPGRVLTAQRGDAAESIDLENCLRITCPGNDPDFARLRGALQEVL